MNRVRGVLAVIAAALYLSASAAFAGPFILAGTDGDDHGYVDGSGNQEGWFFMQRSLENIGAGVTNSNKAVVVLGSTSTAGNAANSAFDLSNLVGAGWSRTNISTAGFADFFAGIGAVNINNTGILMMDSGSNVTGGINGSAFVPYASTINNFVFGGGGLFSQANGYSWLTALLPAILAIDESDTGINLTAAGLAAFPGLTNADLSSGPYHQRFEGYSPIPVLGISASTGSAIILGGTGGSITNPGEVPEPTSLLLLGLGVAGLAARRFGKAAQV